jgi:histone acetyltransferase (RNA polymerase elongator complex component)
MEKSPKPFIIPIFIPHAGCPHRCVFCDQATIAGEKDTAFSPEKFHRQVNRFLKFKSKRRNPVQVAFYGGNFLGLPESTIDAMLAESAGYIQAGEIHGIRFSTRPDTIDEKRLAMLKNFPVTTIELGVQSMDDQILTRSRRGHTAADTEKAVGILKDRNYEIGLQMMIGLPGDDDSTALFSARKIAGLAPDFARIYPTVVLAGSPLARWYEKGSYTPLPLDIAVSLTKKLYLLFAQRHIPVVRIGLQASEDLDDTDAVLAGPYHPAFGHMVYGEIFLDKARALLSDHTAGTDTVTLSVHPRSRSRLQGIRNQNIKILKSEFALKSIQILSDDFLAGDDVRIV